jgi:hypothetical protein
LAALAKMKLLAGSYNRSGGYSSKKNTPDLLMLKNISILTATKNSLY